jgi:TP901 family phage tail tape measure protein
VKDRTITLKIGANITDLQGKLRKAQNDMKDWTNQAQKDLQQHRAQWTGLSNTVGGFGLAMVGMSALAVKGFADFDKSMSRVKSTGADAAANLGDLRDAAIKAGADTQYSASQAADGITALAKAGVSAKDILGGGLAGSLSLAASGEMDVKEAAETTSVALNQFHLDGSKASHVADLLAAGAGKAMGDVTDLGMALRQGGLVASQTGLSIEETTGALSAFAAAGMLGSDSGTSLKTMLQRLTPQSAEAQAQFDELGISAYDAQGQFVGLANFAGQLQQKMATLEPEARNAAMGVMFGSDAVRGANVLFSEGQFGIQGWIDKVNDAGFAARQASTLTDNLSGDLERLRGSIDTVFIQSGSGANNALRGMAQSAEWLVNELGKVPEPTLNAITLLTGSAGLGLGGAAGMMKLVGAISDTRDALANLGRGATIAKFGIAGVGTALGVGFTVLSAWAAKSAEMASNSKELAATLKVTAGQVLQTSDTVADLIDRLSFSKEAGGSLAGTPFQKYGAGMKTAADLAAQFGLTVTDLVGVLSDNATATNKVSAALAEYDTWQSRYMGAGGPDSDKQRAAMALNDQLAQMRTELTDAQRATLQKANADKQAGTATEEHTDAINDQVSALKALDAEMFNHANQLLKLSGTQIGWERALDDTKKAISDTGKAHRLANGYLDLNTEKGRKNQEALNGLAQSSIAYAQNLIEQGASGEKVQKVMERSREAFIKQAVAAGMTSTAAKQLADDLQLIPSDVPVLIKSELDRKGIDEWTAYRPGDKWPNIKPKLTQSTFEVTLKTAWRISGGPKFQMAEGGLLRAFADGGFEDHSPNIYRRPAGIRVFNEPETDGEAYIPLAKSKRARSIQIWEQTGRELGVFAKGGISKANARERASLLADLRKQLRRGEIDVSSGSGMSIIDQMLEWADNSALSKSRRSALSKTALAAEKKLTDLTTRLTAATNQVDSLQSVYDDVQKSLGNTDLASMLLGPQRTDLDGNIWYEAPSASSITAGMAGKAAKVRAFANKLGQLQKAGMAPAVLQDIASLGVTDGSTAADAYLADVGQIAGINAAYAELASASGAGAQYVTEASYKGGLSAAKGLVDGLNADLASLGQSLAGAFASALGYKVAGTTLKKRALGGPVAAGELYQVNEMGMEIFRPAVSGVILTHSQSQKAIASGPSIAQFSDAQIQTLARAMAGAVASMTVAQQQELARSFRYAQEVY